jgi:predicted glycosyltransferase
LAPALLESGLDPHHDPDGTPRVTDASQPPDDGAARILLYSHDSYGLGHLRRCSTLAAALVRDLPGASVLIATGSPCATQFALPAGVEVVKLPSVTKDGSGRYVPRTLPGGADFTLYLRRSLLSELFAAFAPHLLVVDHQVTGLHGELLPVLEQARRAGTSTVLGLRDVIDEPAAVARDWSTPDVRRALSGLYDRVCVYGSPAVFDTRREYPVPPELAERVSFLGYVVREAPAGGVSPLPAERPQVLVTVGGGEDGGGRLQTYLDCLTLAPAPWDSVLVLGPLLDPAAARHLRRQARLLDGVTVHGFHADLPRLLSESQAVVSMAGYNSTSEILQSGVSAVLLPRTFPRREQYLRASRLAELGLLQCLPAPDARSLRAAVEAALASPRGTRAARGLVPLDGDRRLCALASDLLGRPLRAAVAAAS